MNMKQLQLVRGKNHARDVSDPLLCMLGFLWYNSDVLYSVAKDKYFIRQEIEGSYVPDQLLRRNAVSWNAHGDVSFAVDKNIHDDFVNAT